LRPDLRILLTLLLFLVLPAGTACAGALKAKTYIIEMTSSQVASGYANYLVPPLAKVFDNAGLKAMRGPGADIVVNLITHSDVGQWMTTSKGKEWLYTVTITAGISAESYVIPTDGTPQFASAVSLVTPNGDREDELACLIRLAARNAIEHYRPKGRYKASGQQCLRRE
jgi:hypothetical protein